MKNVLNNTSIVSSPGLPRPQSWHISPFIRYSVYIILICTLFDALIVSYIAFQYVHLQKQSATSSSSVELELRSTYVNFDRLYGLDGGQQLLKPAPHEPIVNLPRAWAQVSRAEPEKVFEMWPESWMSEHGLIPNDDRRFWVTPKVGAFTFLLVWRHDWITSPHGTGFFLVRYRRFLSSGSSTTAWRTALLRSRSQLSRLPPSSPSLRPPSCLAQPPHPMCTSRFTFSKTPPSSTSAHSPGKQNLLA